MGRTADAWGKRLRASILARMIHEDLCQSFQADGCRDFAPIRPRNRGRVSVRTPDWSKVPETAGRTAKLANGRLVRILMNTPGLGADQISRLAAERDSSGRVAPSRKENGFRERFGIGVSQETANCAVGVKGMSVAAIV